MVEDHHAVKKFTIVVYDRKAVSTFMIWAPTNTNAKRHDAEEERGDRDVGETDDTGEEDGEIQDT